MIALLGTQMETSLAGTGIQYEGGTTIGIFNVDVAIVVDIPGELQGLRIYHIALLVIHLVNLNTASAQRITLFATLVEYHGGIKLVLAAGYTILVDVTVYHRTIPLAYQRLSLFYQLAVLRTIRPLVPVTLVSAPAALVVILVPAIVIVPIMAIIPWVIVATCKCE